MSILKPILSLGKNKIKKPELRGRKEEREALKFLQKKGLKLVEANYHSRFGEIDIIMYDNNDLVFIEVKARKENAQVTAIESINQQKINKIVKTAKQYLVQFDKIPNCRFDVIAITKKNRNINNQIDWIKNAF